MHADFRSCRLAAVIFLSVVKTTAMAAQPATDIESQLLSEGQWTWRSGNGNTAVWFEKLDGQLTMLRCPAPSAVCRLKIQATPGGFEVESGDSRAVFNRLAGTSVMFGSSVEGTLFPSWVVPTSGSRTGH